MTKSASLSDFLPDEDIRRALEIYRTDRKNFHKRCKDEIIFPQLQLINVKLGQENDADFLAFAVEAVFAQLIE